MKDWVGLRRDQHVAAEVESKPIGVSDAPRCDTDESKQVQHLRMDFRIVSKRWRNRTGDG
jgi:hypothetical protein